MAVILCHPFSYCSAAAVSYEGLVSVAVTASHVSNFSIFSFLVETVPFEAFAKATDAVFRQCPYHIPACLVVGLDCSCLGFAATFLVLK